MVHQPSAGFQGQATDIEIHANEVLSLKKRLNEIYSKHTGKSVDEIKQALERDNFMTPEDAKNFGLIDKVVEKRIWITTYSLSTTYAWSNEVNCNKVLKLIRLKNYG